MAQDENEGSTDTALTKRGTPSCDTSPAHEDSIQTAGNMLIALQKKHAELESQSQAVQDEIARIQARLALWIQEHGLAEDVSQRDQLQSPAVQRKAPGSKPAEKSPQSSEAKFPPLKKANLGVTREPIHETSGSATVNGQAASLISDSQRIECSGNEEKEQDRQQTIDTISPRQSHVLTRQSKRKMGQSLEPLDIPVDRVGAIAEPQSEELQGEKSRVFPKPQRSQSRSSESPRKRRRLQKQTTAEADEDEGYTSSDSLTGDPTYATDWRICQIKTAYAAADQSVRQYWHWIEEKDLLEHLVIQRVGHITGWRAYRKPLNFHLGINELSNILYSDDSLMIVIERAPRRVTRNSARTRVKIAVSFMRQSTKERFLEFMRARGVHLERTDM